MNDVITAKCGEEDIIMRSNDLLVAQSPIDSDGLILIDVIRLTLLYFWVYSGKLKDPAECREVVSNELFAARRMWIFSSRLLT